MNTTELHCIEHMQRINTSSSGGCRPFEGREPFLGGVASRYFIYTTTLHLLYWRFRCGLLGCSGLLWWVMVQKRL